MLTFPRRDAVGYVALVLAAITDPWEATRDGRVICRSCGARVSPAPRRGDADHLPHCSWLRQDIYARERAKVPTTVQAVASSYCPATPRGRGSHAEFDPASARWDRYAECASCGLRWNDKTRWTTEPVEPWFPE